MAHFARINSDNRVQEIIVVHNDAITDENGDESEALGQAFISSLGMQGTWLQCSYNGTFRGVYPGIGYTYDSVADVFVEPEVSDEAV